MNGTQSRSGEPIGQTGNTGPQCDGSGTSDPNRMQSKTINAYFSGY